MALLADKHLQKDFFILDIADVVPKDDTASMEHPLFSLATKPDMRHLTYCNGNDTLEIFPGSLGLPTIKDKDILIFCISQMMHRKNRGEPLKRRVRFSARELMIATNRNTDGREYKRLEKAFLRLQGTQFKSNIRTGDAEEVRIFSLIDEGGFVVKAGSNGRLDYCEVVLSDWIMRAIESNEIVTISRDYFRLRRPLERRIYELARKHCGEQKQWKIGLAKLQGKVGSNSTLRRFRLNLNQVIRDDHVPFYRIELTSDDIVIFRPRTIKTKVAPTIELPEWAEEAARPIARHKGWDYYALRQKWLDFAVAKASKGNPPDNAGAAFVAYCNKQKNWRE